MSSNLSLILGTRNRKKGEELHELLAPLGIVVETLGNYPNSIDVVEDGDSFAANARLKAAGQAVAIGAWVLGEDSGIAVDALDGAPGIYSARFSAADATDEENNRHLLEQLGNLPPERRCAKYVCHMTLCDPAGTVRAESEAECRGRIRTEPSGTHGFGYDPLFEVVEYHRTFGQLGPVVKSAVSHRARAAAMLIPQLRRLISDGDWSPPKGPNAC